MIRLMMLISVSLIAALSAERSESNEGAAMATVELVAHRGESFDAPENTLAAFRLAWDRKVTAIELDVRLTSDGQLVCIHDADTHRTTGTKLVVRDSPWDRLQALDAGRWKNERFAGEKLPLLSEALASIPDGCRCFIEVKAGPEAVPELARVCRASGLSPAQMPVIAFDDDVIAAVKKAMPEYRAYWLAAVRKDKQSGELTPSIKSLLERAEAINADGLDLNVPPDAGYIEAVRGRGMPCYVWTVNDPAAARKYIAAGVNGITTDRAEWMRDQLAK